MSAKTTMYYNGVNYTRESNNDIAESVDTIRWFEEGDKEIFNNEFLHELENHYETIITNSIGPIPTII